MAQLAFIDCETRSRADVTVCGAYAYARHPSTDCLIWGVAFDDAPAFVWSPAWAYGNRQGTRPDHDRGISQLIEHVRDGGYVVAWNANFDRQIWNEVMASKYGWPRLDQNQVLCAQAQAEANNLPGKLEKACKALGTQHTKDTAGGALIAQLSTGTRDDWNPLIHEGADKMGRFRAYCRRDVESMRDVWQYTRPLTVDEWHDYHVSERINDRGVAVDVEFARAAKEYADVEFAGINGQLHELTGDPKLTLSAHLRKAKWLHGELEPYNEELAEIVRRPEREPGKPRYSCDRPTREAVLELLMQPEHAETIPGGDGLPDRKSVEHNNPRETSGETKDARVQPVRGRARPAGATVLPGVSRGVDARASTETPASGARRQGLGQLPRSGERSGAQKANSPATVRSVRGQGRKASRRLHEASDGSLVVPEASSGSALSPYDRIVRFIELIEAGNSAAVRKFTAICNQYFNGRIYGQYSFNGAGQTGRFSSRGVQIHNLIRAPVEKGNPDRAMDAIEAVLAGALPAELTETFGYPVSRLLARLIRPTFIAPEGRMLVWADYDQIEGRTLPWLSNSPLAAPKLAMYASGVDVYTETARDIRGGARDAPVDDHERQAYGKVPELALGFGGAVGALSAMSRGYGVVLADDQKQPIVDRWRAANPWARAFWDELWQAAMAAFAHPGVWYHAGRVKYLYHPTFMRGTLICELPGGRWIVYPQFRHEPVEYEDPETGRRWIRWRTSYVKGFGSGAARVELWYGVLAENVAQGFVATVLRLALQRIDQHDIIVLHTHDELVAECDERHVRRVKRLLTEAMIGDLPEYCEGLPLTVSVEHGPFYTK